MNKFLQKFLKQKPKTIPFITSKVSRINEGINLKIYAIAEDGKSSELVIDEDIRGIFSTAFISSKIKNIQSETNKAIKVAINKTARKQAKIAINEFKKS